MSYHQSYQWINQILNHYHRIKVRIFCLDYTNLRTYYSTAECSKHNARKFGKTFVHVFGVKNVTSYLHTFYILDFISFNRYNKKKKNNSQQDSVVQSNGPLADPTSTQIETSTNNNIHMKIQPSTYITSQQQLKR
ncbi:hypothetical protein ACTA71_003487 [Dictyostelium dimigraforme]